MLIRDNKSNAMVGDVIKQLVDRSDNLRVIEITDSYYITNTLPGFRRVVPHRNDHCATYCFFIINKS